MTEKQRGFIKLLTDNMMDYDESFHKSFIYERIKQIPEDKLKYLLEAINMNKDKIDSFRNKTYKQFVYYADKLINEELKKTLKLPNKNSSVDELYEKREMLIQTLLNSTNSINERNQLIENLQSRKSIFEVNGKNILDERDYYIIEQFGFYNFFDSNKNYMIKEELEKHLLNYTLLIRNSPNKKLLK